MAGKSWQVGPDTTVQVVDPMGTEKKVPPRIMNRNWASITISLSMIAFVLLMVAIAILLMGPQPPLFYGRRLLMRDLYDEGFRPEPMPYQWLQGDKLAYMSEGAGVRLLDLNTGTNITLVTELALRQTEAVEFSVSPDLRFVLLCHDVIKERLYTRTALYSIYDVATNHYHPLTLKNARSSAAAGIPSRLQHARWTAQTTSASSSPDQTANPDAKSAHPNPSSGRKFSRTSSRGSTVSPARSSLLSQSSGNALIIVCKGTLYYMASPSAEPVNLSPDADPDTLSYGAPDLLYQEILQEDAAVWSSPSGHAILVASFNDSNVRELPVLRYTGGYPTVHNLRYSTVDTPLPEVSLWLLDLSSPHYPPSRTRLFPPPSFTGAHYLVGSGWADNGRVWATWVGGDQASSALTLCSAPYWFCSTVLLHHRAGGVSPVLRGVQWAGKWAAFPWAATDSEGTWHNHVALVGEAGGRRAPLTSPQYHVQQVMAANLDTQLVYFKGTELSDMKEGIYNEQIYRSSADGSNDVTCVTCHLKNKNVRFSAKLHKEEETEEEMNSVKAGHAEKESTPWDEWTDIFRDINRWKNWGSQTSYASNLTVGGNEIDRDYGIEKDSNSDGPLKKEGSEPNNDKTEIAVGVIVHKLYNKCSSVEGSLSHSSNYLVVVCLDNNGVPPSLWLIDLLQSFKENSRHLEQHQRLSSRSTKNVVNGDVTQISEVGDGDEDRNEVNGHMIKIPAVGEVTERNLGSNDVNKIPKDGKDLKRNVGGNDMTQSSRFVREAGRNDGFGSQEANKQDPASIYGSERIHPPLLLHSQSSTRIKMGVFGMASRLWTGMLVEGRGGAPIGGSVERGRRSLHARVTLTIPPGWVPDVNTLLYPLVVHLIGPDEPPTSSGTQENEMGFQWGDYLSSGHHVAHASVHLWGGDPSIHTSAHQLAEYHVEAIRELLERYNFLDGDNLAVYGRGGLGASIALEAAALTPPLFHCVAVINPITDWHAHGVFWSERILGPVSQEGAEQRYVESNAARLAPEYRNSTPLLLVHGTADQYAHHGFSLAHELSSHAAHFSHVVYPNEPPSMPRPSRHLLAELEYFIFSWIHDPVIYEDTEGDDVYDATEESIRKYENRFDIKRSFGKLSSIRK